MRKLGFLAVLMLAITPAFAQGSSDDKNHGEFGVFADYFRLGTAKANEFGLGGRLGVNVHPHVALEGEISYDFRENHSTDTGSAFGSVPYKADFRVLHGLFGPKFQTTGPVRLFMVLKGGFINFGVSTQSAPVGFTNSFGGVIDGDTHGAFYPGGGVEAFAGWFGIRGEVGDEIYWSNGAHNNMKIEVGPVIRF
jgi:hypothetical protein